LRAWRADWPVSGDHRVLAHARGTLKKRALGHTPRARFQAYPAHDRAVWTAYGWHDAPATTAEDAILPRLLALFLGAGGRGSRGSPIRIKHRQRVLSTRKPSIPNLPIPNLPLSQDWERGRGVRANPVWHDSGMKRTTIDTPDELLDQLRRVADERGISVDALILEALAEKAGEGRPIPRSLGAGASDHTDTARRSADERPAPRSWR